MCITKNEEKLNNILGFWHDKCIVISKCPGMIISLFSIMNGHMFQFANEHKGIWSRTALGDMVAYQHPEICVKLVSR